MLTGIIIQNLLKPILLLSQTVGNLGFVVMFRFSSTTDFEVKSWMSDDPPSPLIGVDRTALS